MADLNLASRSMVADVLQRYGKCVELVPIDPNFHDITVGLYFKDGTATVWTFSHRQGVESRIEGIRDQLGSPGGMVPVEGTHNQARFSCGQLHERPMKFLLMQAVEKAPDYTLPSGRIKDLRSPLMLDVEAKEVDGRWVYRVTGEGEVPRATIRLRAVTGGFVRYGDMEQVGENDVAFPCGERHDELARLTLPYSRNVTGVQSMLDEVALRGQMTTGTLGFTPPT